MHTLTSLLLAAAIVSGACDGMPALQEQRSGFSYLPSFPPTQESVWSNEAQGVANDGTSWFISDRWAIYKYPVAADPGGDGYVAEASLPSECGHIGDIDHAAGSIYAPLELCEGRSPNRIYVFDAQTLAVQRWGVIPTVLQAHASWVAVSPIDGNLYSSDFDASLVNVYAPRFADGENLTLLRRIYLGSEYHHIQGGAFSADGRLFLVSDDTEQPERAGIFVFEIDGPAAAVVGSIPPAAGYPDGGAEMEGITVWNLDNVEGKNPSAGGQIHWINLDNDGFFDSDDAALEHVRADHPETM